MAFDMLTHRYPRTLTGVNAAFKNAEYADPIEHYYRPTFWRQLCIFTRRMFRR
jgi:hypothetical protein